MLDIAWRPGLDFASASYAKREAHHRKLADAAFREWQAYFGLAEKYRLLAEKAAAVENRVA